MMKSSGIETRADFELFIKAYPGIQENVPVFKEIDEAYPHTVYATEIFDNFKTRAAATLQNVKDWYTDSFPECPI